MPHARTAAARQLYYQVGKVERELPLATTRSGYIRFIDLPVLVARAKARQVRIRLTRRVGHFVPAGFALFMVSHSDQFEPDDIQALQAAVDIGPTGTLSEQDAEFGVLQIVDIALRAISPAVNDPSTAINCIDQLSRIMIRWIGRDAPDGYLASPPHVVRVVMRWVTTTELLDTAFEQIRHYAASDFAVSMRLLKALSDISLCAADDDDALRDQLRSRGKRIVEGSSPALSADDVSKLKGRLSTLEQSCRTAAATA